MLFKKCVLIAKKAINNGENYWELQLIKYYVLIAKNEFSLVCQFFPFQNLDAEKKSLLI